MIETVDLVIRSACIGICSLLAIHFATIRPVSRKTISTIAFLISSAGMIVATSLLSMKMMELSTTWHLVVTALVAITPIFIAWGLLELFEDDFKVQPWQAIFVIASVPTHFFSIIYIS